MQQKGYKEPADADDLKQLNKTSIGSGSAGKRSEEQSQLFSPSAAQLQELLQFAVESAANDKTKPEGKSVLQTDAQLSGSTAKGCSNEERADKRVCPLPVVTTVLIEETKETKCSSRSVSTENLDIPGSPATRRATSKETKTSSKETTTLTKSTTRSTENLHTLGSLGSPNSLLVDFQTKCPEEKVAFGGGAASRQGTENDGLLAKKFGGSTKSIQSIGKCNCAPFYENKIACLRDSINELSKKTEKQGQENEKLLKENKDFKSAFSYSAKQLEEKEETIKNLQKELSSLSEELNCEKMKQKTTEERQISDAQKLGEEISSTKELLDAEVRRRESAEENYKKAEADLEEKSTQLKQLSEREAVRKANYEERLEKALRELRTEYEVKMRESREELGRVYKARLKEVQVKAREQKEDKKIREQREEKEELARRVASLEMASLEVRKKVDQLGDKVEDQKSQASDEGEAKQKELLLQQMHHESLLELRMALDAKIAALEVVVAPQELKNDKKRESNANDLLANSVDEERKEETVEEEEEEEGESLMEKRISQNA